MRKSRFTEEQIIKVLKEHAAGVPAGELARKYGISDAVCATNNEPVPAAAKSNRSNAIVSLWRWYKKAVRLGQTLQ